MGTWSFDMSKAPRGKFRLIAAKGNSTRKIAERADIIVAGACGTVTVSRWLDDSKRFDMFTAEHPPIAWMPFAGPEIIAGEDGKARRVIRLPPHPTQSESWFAKLLRERRAA